MKIQSIFYKSTYRNKNKSFILKYFNNGWISLLQITVLTLIIFSFSCASRGPGYTHYSGTHRIPELNRNTTSSKKLTAQKTILKSSNKNTNQQQTSSSLARVIILQFINKTDKYYYNWLSRNIANAVQLDMVNKFEFEKVSNKKYLEQIKMMRLTKIKNMPNQIIQMTKNKNIDIIIFGYYTFNNQTQKLQINSSVIYIDNKGNTKIIAKVEETTPIDNQLFEATERIATKVVKKIAEYEQNKTQQ